MTHETTLGALVAAEDALQALAQQPLPVIPAYRVAKLMRQMATETAHFHSQREQAVRELGDPIEAHNGTPAQIRVGPANWPTFETRMRDLAAVPVTLDLIPLDLDALGATVTLTGVQMNALVPFVVLA